MNLKMIHMKKVMKIVIMMKKKNKKMCQINLKRKNREEKIVFYRSKEKTYQNKAKRIVKYLNNRMKIKMKLFQNQKEI